MWEHINEVGARGPDNQIVTLAVNVPDGDRPSKTALGASRILNFAHVSKRPRRVFEEEYPRNGLLPASAHCNFVYANTIHVAHGDCSPPGGRCAGGRINRIGSPTGSESCLVD